MPGTGLSTWHVLPHSVPTFTLYCEYNTVIELSAICSGDNKGSERPSYLLSLLAGQHWSRAWSSDLPPVLDHRAVLPPSGVLFSTCLSHFLPLLCSFSLVHAHIVILLLCVCSPSLETLSNLSKAPLIVRKFLWLGNLQREACNLLSNHGSLFIAASLPVAYGISFCVMWLWIHREPAW